MSSDDLTLSTRLVMQALDGKLSDLMVEKLSDYSDLKLAFGDMMRFLVHKKIITQNAQKAWIVDDKALTQADDMTRIEATAPYRSATMAIARANAELVRDGQSDFLAKFREDHKETLLEIMPDTITRVRGEDMQAISSGALNLLQAVHDDPANAAFVPGLNETSLQELREILHGSGYLMPGENPDRKTALGTQPLRGSPEQRDALFHKSQEIATNLDLPEGPVDAGDKPRLAATLLRKAVANAHVEEVVAEHEFDVQGFDSDLTGSDCNKIYNVGYAFISMVHGSSVDSSDYILAKRSQVEELEGALASYHDDFVDKCLSSGNMGDPSIDPAKAKKIAETFSMIQRLITEDPKVEFISGDQGGISTQGGKFRDDHDVEGEGLDDVDAENNAATNTGKGTVAAPVEFDADADLGADLYGHSDPMVRLNEPTVCRIERELIPLIDDRTFEYLRQRAGRHDTGIGEIASVASAFGNLDEAMGADRMYSARMNLETGLYTQAEMMAKGGAAPTTRMAVIEEGRGPFRGFHPKGKDDYTHGSPSVSARRFKTWVDQHMVRPDGAPNYDLRRWLRDAAELPIQGRWRREAEAARDYAKSFVQASREEVEARRHLERESRGISSAAFERDQIGRFLEVKDAASDGWAASELPVKVTIGSDRSITIADPDAPKLTSAIDKIDDKLAKSLEAPATKREKREFGGMISVGQLRAAYQTGAKQVTLLIDGENPYAMVGKMVDEQTRKKEKVKDVVLS